MTKELKIQDAVNDDNPITKKLSDDKTKSVYFYCNNLSHNNSNILGSLASGANDLISKRAHFSLKHQMVTQFLIYMYL